MPLASWKINVLQPKISEIEKENHETHIVVFHVNIQGCTYLGGYLLGMDGCHQEWQSEWLLPTNQLPVIVFTVYYTCELSSD